MAYFHDDLRRIASALPPSFKDSGDFKTFLARWADSNPAYFLSPISTNEAAELMGITPGALRNRRCRGDGPPGLLPEAMAVATDPLLYLGRADEAVALMERAIDINPITPGWYFNELSRAYWAVGRCDEGLEAIKRRPTLRAWDYRAMIVNLTCLGDIAEAQKVAAKLLEFDPDFTISAHGNQIRETINNPEFLERWLNGLRAAGLPEN